MVGGGGEHLMFFGALSALFLRHAAVIGERLSSYFQQNRDSVV